MSSLEPRILYGVPFHTMDGHGTVAESVVVSGGRILFAGDADAAARRYPRAEREDLQLGCVIPGFVDAHLHLKAYSLLYRDLDLTGTGDRGDALELVKQAVSSRKKGEWVRGGGADAGLLGSLSRYDLDELAPATPVALFSRDLRAVLASSAALSLAGIDENRKDPLGGTIERDSRQVPTGILKERALELVKGAMPADSAGDIDRAVERGMKNLLAHGVTSFCDCASSPTDSPITSVMKLWHRDRMPMRAVLMFGDRDASRLGALGLPALFGNELVKIGGCKLVADGSLASLTGLMSRHYQGRETAGMQLMDEEELYQAMRRSYTRYMWTAVHAVGDRANRTTLNAYERLLRDRGIPRLLMRVEHAKALQDEDVQRFASLGVFAVGNPAHISADREQALRYLGEEARLLHRFGSLREAGAKLALASDAPAGSADPLHGLYLAAERKRWDEGPELRFYPRERLSLEDAVYAYTAGGAAAMGLADAGSLEPGKHADMVHLSLDVLSEGGGGGRTVSRGDRLLQARVVRTFVAGEPVYERRIAEPGGDDSAPL